MMEDQTDILHIDMDAFYASVEELEHPEYKNKPLVIAGKSQRSVVSTANYAARKYNISSAMPLKTAISKCKNLIIISPDFKKYSSISKRIHQILLNYTPDIQQASIDEFYLDIKGSHLLFGTSKEIAEKIKADIKNKLKLTCSIGISHNKLLAKIGSDLDKPDGITIIDKNNMNDILDNLKIEKIPGIGKKSAQILNNKNIYYVKKLKTLNLSELKKTFGINGLYFYNAIRGIGNSKLSYSKEIKSISNEITFEYDTKDIQIIKNELLRLSDHLSARIRKNRVSGKTIRIKLRYYDFKTISRQISLKTYINTCNDIYKYSLSLIEDLIIKPIRLIGVGLTSLKEDYKDTQLSLFPKDEKKLKFEANIDIKFGNNSIKRASLL